MLVKPNYKDGSIVNLMSSISKAYKKRHPYKPLKGFDHTVISQSKNVIFMVIDGLGYEYIKKHGKGTVFEKYMQQSMTSVFPSTTAAAITVFATGLPPQQHGLTGWHTYFKELGAVGTPLRFSPRSSAIPWSMVGVDPKEIFDQKSFFKYVTAKKYVVTEESIVDTDYTNAFSDKAKRYAYEDLSGFFSGTATIAAQEKGKKFIYSYWPGFDALAHEYGIESKKVKQHFKVLNKALKQLIKLLKGTNTTIILTADHGLADVTKKTTIHLKDHPKLEECLTLPLCGELRAAYCYVRPSKVKQFEKYVKTKLKKVCTLHKGEDLIKKGYFGLGKPHPKLTDRVGDYVLLCKDNYIITDTLLGEEKRWKKGQHGGLAKDEMLVPLIVIET